MPTKFFQLLNLSAVEQKIILQLQVHASMTVSALAREIAIPRTTTHFLLKNLERRGLLHRVRVGKHGEWSLADSAVITNQLQIGLQLFSHAKNLGERVVLGDNVVQYSQGLHNIQTTYTALLRAHVGERIYFIQGTQSAKIALQNLSPEFFQKFHAQIKKRRIILEGIGSTELLALFHTLDKKALASHQGRPLITSLVPSRFLRPDIDVLIFRSTLYVINMKKETLLTLESEEVADVLKNFLAYILAGERRMNVNEYVQQLLERKK
ncbi:MAG: helix-turn-helix domain-containing protein [Patescibacteria group bacterium]|jgi:hypothetical protein